MTTATVAVGTTSITTAIGAVAAVAMAWKTTAPNGSAKKW
jgi:hypothetical protein